MHPSLYIPLWHDDCDWLHNKICQMYLEFMNINWNSIASIKSSINCNRSHQNYATYFCSISVETIFIYQWHYSCNCNMVQNKKGKFWRVDCKQNGQFMGRRPINCRLPSGQSVSFCCSQHFQIPSFLFWATSQLQLLCHWYMNWVSTNMSQKYDA